MVDVTAKVSTLRQAVAWGSVRMRPETVALIEQVGIRKRDVLATARIVANLTFYRGRLLFSSRDFL